MQKTIAVLFFLFATIKAQVPFLDIFDGILINSGKTFIYNYGLNSAFMATGTYAIVQTETDWKWRQFSYSHKSISTAGMPAVLTGGLAPVIVPLSLYGVGRSKEDLNMQTAGIAVAQATIISTTLTTGIKAFTSRRPPELRGDEKTDEKEDFSKDFKFGFLKRIPFDGWPSGHTSAAWAMAATLTEFYPDNIPLAVGLYGYAFYMGFGVSTTIHWLSDAWAGAFFGYAVGKTVAQHFKKNDSRYSVVLLPGGFMVVRGI